MVIPSLVDSVTSLYNLIIKKWPEWADFFTRYDIDTSRVTQWLENLDLKNLLSHVTNGAGSIISTTVGAVSTVVSSLVSFSLSVVIACYVLLSKKTLARQATKLVKAFCKPKLADRILYLTHDGVTAFDGNYDDYLENRQVLRAVYIYVLLRFKQA